MDLIQPIVYDVHGRADSVSYLPYRSQTSGGIYRGSWASEQAAFYNSLYTGEGPNARSRTSYEASPAGRPMATYTPGSTYVNKPKTMSYTLAGTDVRNYVVTASGGLSISGVYPTNSLTVTTVTDEEGKTVSEYKDKDGRVILSRTPHTTAGTYADTYSVYDDMGRLRYVVSPEAAAATTLNDQVITGLCYYYAYDSRGRLAVKRLPGAAEQWFVYNANNQLVASQDGNLRDAGKWLYYKYDDRGRMIEQGRYTATYASQSAAQAGWNGNLPESAPDAIYTFDSYIGVPATLSASGVTNDGRVF